MTERYVLGIDAGQTAVKAVLHDEALNPVGVGRKASPLDTSVPRHAERSQDALWAATADAIADAIRDAGVNPAQIVSVAVAGHGDGLHLVDADGNGVGPAITAVDSRAYRESAELLADPERSATVLRLSGQLPSVGAPGLLLKWISRNQPELIDRAHAVLSCKDVIRARLTGEIATDLSDACSSFINTDTAEWSSEVLEAYGLAGLERLLPPLLWGGDAAGTVTRAAAERTGLREGTPVIAGVHDVQAASIGMGALIPDSLALVAGSFNTNGVTTSRGDIDARWQSRLSVRPSLRIAMSTSPTASPSVDWLLRTLGAQGVEGRDALFAEAAALAPEEQVPLTLPFLYSSPLGDSASAALAGVRGWHTRGHLLRGMLEGVVLMHYWHTSALAEKFTWNPHVLLGGGLSRSPLYVQLVANALRTPIRVVTGDEAGAFGAAALAAVSAGLYPDLEAAQQRVDLAPEVLPTPESAGYWSDVISSFTELTASLDPWWTARHDSVEEG